MAKDFRGKGAPSPIGGLRQPAIPKSMFRAAPLKLKKKGRSNDTIDPASA